MSIRSVERRLTDRGYSLKKLTIHPDPTGELLRKARLEAGLTIKDISEGLGINEKEAVSFEMGRAQIGHRRFWTRN